MQGINYDGRIIPSLVAGLCVHCLLWRYCNYCCMPLHPLIWHIRNSVPVRVQTAIRVIFIVEHSGSRIETQHGEVRKKKGKEKNKNKKNRLRQDGGSNRTAHGINHDVHSPYNVNTAITTMGYSTRSLKPLGHLAVAVFTYIRCGGL